jgi:hypothetical protein
MEFIKNDWTALVQPLAESVDPVKLRGHAFEFSGINVWLLPKPISSTMLSKIGEHQVDLQAQTTAQLGVV